MSHWRLSSTKVAYLCAMHIEWVWWPGSCGLGENGEEEGGGENGEEEVEHKEISRGLLTSYLGGGGVGGMKLLIFLV